jgi:hypothetical protein
MNFTEIMGVFGWNLTKIYTVVSMQVRKLYNDYQGETEDIFKNYPFTLIEKDNYFQIYYPDVQPVKYKFVQTEIEYEGVKYDVNVKSYMVVGNKLFTREFVKWVLDFYKNVALKDGASYKVHIIDQDVTILTLESNEYLEIESNTYIKKQATEPYF